jgi:hypothetical protein
MKRPVAKSALAEKRPLGQPKRGKTSAANTGNANTQRPITCSRFALERAKWSRHISRSFSTAFWTSLSIRSCWRLFVLLAALFVLMFEAGVDIVKYVLYLG